MKLLDAVNLVMPKLGERPVTSLEVKHPTLAVVLPIFDLIRRKVLGTGWWFNQYPYKAYPNSDGEVFLGSDTLSFVPRTPDFAVQRGLQLFNPYTMLYTYAAPVDGLITQDVPFDSLPESLATYIMYSALLEAYTTDLGVTQELSVWQNQAALAWSDFLAEHLRQKQYSTRRSRQWRGIRRAMQA